VTQQARDLTMSLEGHADGLKFLIRDRDMKFTAGFDAVFNGIGVRIIKTPVQAPRVNWACPALADRFLELIMPPVGWRCGGLTRIRRG
jgi:hypothetical protein